MKLFFTALVMLAQQFNLGIGVSASEGSLVCRSGTREVYCAPFFGKGNLQLQLGNRHPMEKWKDFLYPQYATRFRLGSDFDPAIHPERKPGDKMISPFAWAWVQNEARKNIQEGEDWMATCADGDYAAPRVAGHWREIVKGEIPFGYRLKNDRKLGL